MDEIIKWCNDNQGFLTAILSVITVAAAVGIPLWIAHRQNKIALFENRYGVYNEFVNFTDLKSLDFDTNPDYRYYELGNADAIHKVKSDQKNLSEKVRLLFSNQLWQKADPVIYNLYESKNKDDVAIYNMQRQNTILDFQNELNISNY